MKGDALYNETQSNQTISEAESLGDHLIWAHLVYVVVGGTIALLALLTVFFNPAMVSKLGIEAVEDPFDPQHF